MSITIDHAERLVVDRAPSRPRLLLYLGRALLVVGAVTWMVWMVLVASSTIRASHLGDTADLAAFAAFLVIQLAALGAGAVIGAGVWGGSSGRAVVGEVRLGSVAPGDTAALARSALTRARSWRNLDRIERARVAIDAEGLRRFATVLFVVVVLLTGTEPVSADSMRWVAVLACAAGLISVAHWTLSAGAIRPGDRLVWSMRSITAGVGNGGSPGLPAAWFATMASVVTLNVVVALRGVSDRWTHGLSSMDRDVAVVVSAYALALAVIGVVALRSLARPDIGFYGATGRLEEWSTRRVALAATFGVAVVGFTLGALPPPV